MKHPSSVSAAFHRRVGQRSPYPLATPSWVMPGTYAENLDFLADKTDIAAVELLFFIYDETVAAELKADWERILQYRERFLYTAHLPERLEDHHEKLIEQLAPLVEHFVVHPPAGEKEQETLAQRLLTWEERYTSRRGYRFIIENTQPGRLEGMVEKLPGWGLCLDTGHLQLAGEDLAMFLSIYGNQIQEIHLHRALPPGLVPPDRLADHHPLHEGDPWFTPLLPFLFPRKDPLPPSPAQNRGFSSPIENGPGGYPSFSHAGKRPLINFEVFSWPEVAQSLGVWKKWCTDFCAKEHIHEV
ncbi:TIM barrel protein [Treponema sp. J25]|uniref:TIM barrel protein n=1 Tax=Treponema sp. J25 TaxID=2094121 RepID=UPI001047666B|nr:TIM barrel protein [Treponema sp. J25]TCW60895.1 hypothetical protein C5O22_09590 [Treponema sp. J25]